MTPGGFAVVLPARYQSARFPGKPLAPVAGRPLIEWVYRRACSIPGATRVIVATDDERIRAAVTHFGGEAIMTAADHHTGTDRVAEVAAGMDEAVVVNLQGDEPVFPIGVIVEMVGILQRSQAVDIATACHAIRNAAEFEDGNVVKVVTNPEGRALYFSRAPIPACVHPGAETQSVIAHRHIGIYAFRREKLIEFARLPRTRLEKIESLEQLRALEHGMCVHVVMTEHATLGVDVPGDIKDVEKALSSA